MSTLHCAPEERLIVALDLPDGAAAERLVDRIGPQARFYKIGLELILSGDGLALAERLLERGYKVFLDAKLYDVPETVRRATARVARRGVHLLTVHGDRAIMNAAVEAQGESLGILAVTMLTSLDQQDLADMGYAGALEDLVVNRARAALAAGCSGVVSSGREAARLRGELGPEALIVTPGIRPAGHRGGDGQKRVVTAAEAIAAGASHVVVGRPIRDAADPGAAAAALQAEIADALARAA